MSGASGIILVSRAADFAARRHAAQQRKGIDAEPYVNHLAEVALLLAEATAGGDADLIAAGWLHDTLEDTPTTRDELAELFGEPVAALVAEVTDDKSLPRAERKRRQIATIAGKSARARRLKIADQTSNVRSIVASPPADWDLARRVEYVGWAIEVVARARGLDPFLEARFDAAVTDARRALAPAA